MGILDVFKKRQSNAYAGPPVAYPVPMGMPVPGPMQPEAPVDNVMALQQQGLTNNQIIQTLQRQGYAPQQIYDAMAMAENRNAVEPMPEAPVPGDYPSPQQQQRAPQEQPKGFEEIAEAIVEEKWHEFSRELVKVNEWKDSSASRLDKVEQSVNDMKSDLESLHKAIVSKISEYDKNLLDVGTEIKAMEKVFQKVLPELTGSVAELSRITKAVRAKPAAAPVRKK